MFLFWGFITSHAPNTIRISQMPEKGRGNGQGHEHSSCSLFSCGLCGHQQVTHTSEAEITLPTSCPLPLGTVGLGNGTGVTYSSPHCTAPLSARLRSRRKQLRNKSGNFANSQTLYCYLCSPVEKESHRSHCPLPQAMSCCYSPVH